MCAMQDYSSHKPSYQATMLDRRKSENNHKLESVSVSSKSCARLARLEVCHLQAGDWEAADSSRTLQVCIAVLQIQKFTRFLNSIPEPWDAVPPKKKSIYRIQQNFNLIQFIPPDLSKWQSPIFLTLKQNFCQQTFSAKLHAIAGAVKALFPLMEVKSRLPCFWSYLVWTMSRRWLFSKSKIICQNCIELSKHKHINISLS